MIHSNFNGTTCNICSKVVKHIHTHKERVHDKIMKKCEICGTLVNCNGLIKHMRTHDETCPKGFGLKLAKLGLKTPLKNKVKQKQSQAEPS